MENFIVTTACLLIGMAARRLPAFPRETGTVLNQFVISVSLPALVLLKIPDLVFSGAVLLPALLPWAMLLLSAAAILLLSRALAWDRATTGCLLLLVPLGNTSFLGIPMVKAFFGDTGIPYAVLYDQLGSFLALATYGSVILAYYGSGESRPTPATVARKIVTFPPFVALLLALLLRSSPYPPVAVSLLNILAATLVPLVMIAVGYQLTLRLTREVSSQLCIGLSIKLIAAPVAAWLLCRIAGLHGEAAQVSVFESGMPPMVSAGALAIVADLSPTLSAALAGIGIVASFLTLPLLYRLLQSLG